jgi:putative transcriptional regulator
MNTKSKRKPLGQRLIASMEAGLEALRTGQELPSTFVATPPDPPAFDPKSCVALRRHSGMSQSGFARLLNVSVKAVESWEQGVRQPNGAALRLLQFMARPSLFLGMVGAVRTPPRRGSRGAQGGIGAAGLPRVSRTTKLSRDA